MTTRTKSSPCIGFCSTTYGDQWCRGCFRNLDEVLHWRQKSESDRQSYYNRLSFQSSQIMSVYWSLINPSDLALKIVAENEIYAAPQGPSCPYFSLFQLLQHGINPMTSYSSYIIWNTHEMSLSELSRLISKYVYMALENNL